MQIPGRVGVLPAIDYSVSLVGASLGFVALKTINDSIDIRISHLVEVVGGLGATAA